MRRSPAGAISRTDTFYRLFGDHPAIPLVAQVALNASVPLLTFLAAREWVGERAAALTAVLIGVFSFNTVYASTQSSDAVCTVIVVAALLAFAEARARRSSAWFGLAGVLFGVAPQFRPNLVLLPAALAALYLIARPRRGRKVVEMGAYLVAAGLAWYLSRRIAKPVLALSYAADRIAEGHYDITIPDVPGTGEISHLSERFGDMAARLAATEERERQFLMSVSHELRTPLTAIRGHVAALLEGVVEDPGLREESLGIVEADHQVAERGHARPVALVERGPDEDVAGAGDGGQVEGDPTHLRVKSHQGQPAHAGVAKHNQPPNPCNVQTDRETRAQGNRRERSRKPQSATV